MAMRKTILLLTLCFLVTLFSGPLLAQDPIVYPAKGQNNQQMEKDKYDCYHWAKKQSGFDPMEDPRQLHHHLNRRQKEVRQEVLSKEA